MILSGITNCGKTKFVLDLLTSEYMHYYDYVDIICPTFMWNKTYHRRWIYEDMRVIIIDPSSSSLDKCVKCLKIIFKGTITLFIIDDCANLEDVKKKATALTDLAFSARHYGISVLVICQKYNSIVKDLRENIRMLVLFFIKDRKLLDQTLDENDIFNGYEEKNIIKARLRESKHMKIILRLEEPYSFQIHAG